MFFFLWPFNLADMSGLRSGVLSQTQKFCIFGVILIKMPCKRSENKELHNEPAILMIAATGNVANRGTDSKWPTDRSTVS